MAAPAPPGAPLALSDLEVRAARIAAQHLIGGAFASPATILERSGFVRTLGGADAYLAIAARQPHAHRELIDGAVGSGEVQVIPAVRGCIYLAPRSSAPLCLRIAGQLSASRMARDLAKAGVEAREVDDLAEAALQALTAQGPMTTDALRRSLPPGTVRSLSDRGKKVGISSPLPPALRQLEFEGRIERVPHDGRLDHERYVWRPTVGDALAGADLPFEPVMLHALLLERYLRWSGVATLPQFRAWSGLPAAAAKAALALASHVPVEREDGSAALGSPDLEDLLAAAPSAGSAAALLPFEDNLVHLPGGVRDVADPSLLDLVVPSWGRRAPVALGEATHLAFRTVIADGALAGFWEYDPDAGVAVPFCFSKPSKAAQILLEEQAARTGALLSAGLGHGRSSSIDTDDTLRERLALLRELHQNRGGEAKGRGARKTPKKGAKKAGKPARTRPAANPQKKHGKKPGTRRSRA